MSRVLIHDYKYQAVNLLLSGRFMVIVAPPRRRNQSDSFLFFGIMNYQLLFKTHFVCVKMSDFTIAVV